MEAIVETIGKIVKEKIRNVEENFSAKMTTLEELINSINLKTNEINKNVESMQTEQKLFQKKLSILNKKNDLQTQLMDKKHEKLLENLVQTEMQIKAISEGVEHVKLDFTEKVSSLNSKISNLPIKSGLGEEELMSTLKTFETQKEIDEAITKEFKNEINIIKTELVAVDKKCQNQTCQKLIRAVVQQNTDEFLKYSSNTYTWTITDIDEIMDQRTFDCESPVFSLFGYISKAKAKFQIKDDELAYMSLAFIDDRNHGKPLPLESLPQVTFVLKDLSGSRDQKDRVRQFSYLFNAVYYYGNFHYELKLCHKSWLLNSVYNRDNSIVIEVLIEPPSVSKSYLSNNGILTWKVDNYCMKRQSEIDRLVTYEPSPYFYTGAKGYRAQVLMWLDGLGTYESKGLTATVSFLSGEYDHLLKQSAVFNVTFTLFNQVDPTKHVIKTCKIDIKNATDNDINVLTHKEIESDGFLKDDCLYYKVITDPL